MNKVCKNEFQSYLYTQHTERLTKLGNLVYQLVTPTLSSISAHIVMRCQWLHVQMTSI